MIPSQIKWSPHNRSEYLVISEYLPYFACSVSGSRGSGFIAIGNRMDLSYRNIGLFECQNLKGFNMSTPCDFSLTSTKDSCAVCTDASGQSSSASSAAAASLPSQQGSSSRSTSPSVGVGNDSAASASIAASAFDGNPLGESFGKSDAAGDERLAIPNSGNRPISSRHLSFSLNPAIKVAEWSPKDNLVVLGDESGNGILSDPVQNFKSVGYFNVENKIRSIDILSWNKCDSSQLAVGYSYSKLEDSVNVWDLNVIAPSPYSTFARIQKPKYGRPTPSAPVALSWRPNDDNLLFWGCDSKSIGFFDLRGSAGKSQTFTTDFTYGLAFNPFDPDVFASYSKDGTQIHIWDNRVQSVYSIDAKEPIVQIEWSQKRRGQLGAIVGSDTTEILCWDLTTHNGSDIVSLPKRSPRGKYVSFTWHPEYEGSIIALSDVPEERQWFVEGVSFWDSFPMEFHPTGSVSFTCGRKVFTTQKPLKDDISAVMRERILKGYGIDVKANIAVLQNNPELKKVWEEIQYARDNDASAKKIFSSLGTTIPGGVSSSSSSSSGGGNSGPSDVIGKTDGGMRLRGEKGRDGVMSEKDSLRQAGSKRVVKPSLQAPQVKPVSSPGIPSAKSHDIDIKDDAMFVGCTSIISLESANRNILKSDSVTRMFQSPVRECCKRLCGWNFGSDPKLKVHEFTAFISYLKSQKEYERAAAISVFNQRNQDALDALKELSDYLQQAGNPDNKGYLEALRLLIFALASYQDSQNFFSTLAGKTWSQSWDSLSRTTDPGSYLSSIPTFLQDQSLSSCNVILKLAGMRLADRIAFGCCYVNTKELEVFTHEEEKAAVKDGDLRGLILCGINTESAFELLQRYIDKTGDVQTASLISLIPYHVGVSATNPHVQRWLKVYRGLFDVWKLWNERALLDVKVQTYLNNADVPPQVYALCKCGRPLKSKVENESLSKISKQHTSFCPECHTTLPRCSVCLLPLDCIRVKSYSLSASPSREFGHWWSWCQTCGHGGHISHVQEWFSCHSICPANGCKCQCRNQDKFLFVGNNTNEPKIN